MTDTLKIICENNGKELYITPGTSLSDILAMSSTDEPGRFIAAFVNNSIKELRFRVYNPVSIRFIDITHHEGIRVYQRTVFFTLYKAVADLYPGRKFQIKHAVSKGFYCEIEGLTNISQQEVDALKERMHHLIDNDIPIVRRCLLTSEVEEIYRRSGLEYMLTLLKTRPRLYSTIYSLADMVGYFYGALGVSTGIVTHFDICKYYKGIYVAMPKRSDPTQFEPMIDQDKMFEVFEEYSNWVKVIGVSTIGTLNTNVIEGRSGELIKIAEALHEKKLSSIADTIAKAKTERDVKIILISGPSSSGKTTFAKRLGIQLRIVGFQPALISLDDYFVERERTPRDENGDYDYETLDAIDVEAFNSHLNTLLEGGKVDIPRYDFITGKRQWHNEPLELGSRGILVIEGIHGLNPQLTREIEERFKFKIYVSAFTSISMDNLSRISTTDNRLLRRLVRDHATRGTDALATLKRWQSVRKGEDKHIFPYQENADVMFNSSLFYEISVLKPFAEPMLREVPNTSPEYGEAKRMLKFINNFIAIDPTQIPPTSLLREFIGGSSFTY